VATKLPTYEEVQQEKTLQGEHTSPRVPLAFLAIDTESPDGENESGLLGTDFMFFTAFLGKVYRICGLNIQFCTSLNYFIVYMLLLPYIMSHESWKYCRKKFSEVCFKKILIFRIQSCALMMVLL